jgi:hypothetical protein
MLEQQSSKVHFEIDSLKISIKNNIRNNCSKHVLEFDAEKNLGDDVSAHLLPQEAPRLFGPSQKTRRDRSPHPLTRSASIAA